MKRSKLFYKQNDHNQKFKSQVNLRIPTFQYAKLYFTAFDKFNILSNILLINKVTTSINIFVNKK